MTHQVLALILVGVIAVAVLLLVLLLAERWRDVCALRRATKAGGGS